MSTHELLEDRLRQALRDGETALTAAPDLAEVSVARGRARVRRRNRLAVAAAAGGVAVVLGVGALVVPHGSSDDEPPAHRGDGTTGAVPAATWVGTLSEGDPPGVAYVGGTTVHLREHVLPFGDEGYVEVDPVGQTVVGTVVLGTRPDGSADAVLIAPDTTTQVVATTPTGGVRGAAVSPDGRFLAADGRVLDLSTSATSRLPRDAVAVTGWIPSGVTYVDRHRREHVWLPGDQPWSLDRLVWFPGHTGAGIALSGRCPLVVTVDGPGDVRESPRRCAAKDVLTVSPDGRWLVTKQLGVVDVADGSTRWLAGGPLAEPAAMSDGSTWSDDAHLVVAVPLPGPDPVDGRGALVRCDVTTGACDRATGPVETAAEHTIKVADAG